MKVTTLAELPQDFVVPFVKIRQINEEEYHFCPICKIPHKCNQHDPRRCVEVTGKDMICKKCRKSQLTSKHKKEN
jgi:hypothetical protein